MMLTFSGSTASYDYKHVSCFFYYYSFYSYVILTVCICNSQHCTMKINLVELLLNFVRSFFIPVIENIVCNFVISLMLQKFMQLVI